MKRRRLRKAAGRWFTKLHREIRVLRRVTRWRVDWQTDADDEPGLSSVRKP